MASGWRLMLVPPRAAAENMAREIALMERARTTGEAVFSVYEWERRTLSLGRNQLARGRYDLNRLRDEQIDVVRRPTGGRALIHQHEITYSVTAPLHASQSIREWYARINQILLHALAAAGIDGSVAEHAAKTLPVDTAPCFAAPARGEILAGGAKLVGSAQWCDRGALLQHGSILIDDRQHLLADLTLAGDTIAMPAPATLASLLKRVPTVPEVARALFEAVRAVEDAAATPVPESEVRQSAIEGSEYFENERWTWRR